MALEDIQVAPNTDDLTEEGSPTLDSDDDQLLEPDATGNTSDDDELTDEQLEALEQTGENQIPGPRFKQLNQKKKDAIARAEALELEVQRLRQQHASVPTAETMAQAIRLANQPEVVQVDPDEEFYRQIDQRIADEGEDSVFASEMEKTLYYRDKANHQRTKSLTQQLQNVQQENQQTIQQRAMAEFESTIESLLQQSGVRLTAEQKQEVGQKAFIIGSGYKSGNIAFDVATITEDAFTLYTAKNQVAKASADSRAAAVRATKVGITQRRPGGATAGHTEPDYSKMSDRDVVMGAVDEAFAKAGIQ